MKNWAKHELELAGLFDKDSDYEGMLGEAVLELFTCFIKQDHSGYSAGVTVNLFKRLADGIPLTPLQGTLDEWKDVGGGEFQNRRMSSVFADDKYGRNAHYLYGRTFVNKDGLSFTCRESCTLVEFPWIPETIYIKEGTKEAEEFAHVFD